MGTAKQPAKRKRKTALPPFDPVACVVEMLGPGRHIASDIRGELQAVCLRYGVPVPNDRALGKRLSGYAKSVTRERVYLLEAAA